MSGSKSLLIILIPLLASCSLPTLESPECRDARNAVRSFYSYHLGEERTSQPDSAKLDKNALSEQLRADAKNVEGQADYFTKSADLPRAFRVAGCSSDQDRALFDVLLFWRDEERTEQREVKVLMIKEGERWLIDSVFAE